MVVHAYRFGDGTMDVVAAADTETFTVTITDHGVGMAPRLDSPGLGLGLAIIAGICSHCDVQRTADGTELRMTFARGRAAA